jgi:hypothetical protein
MNVSFPSFISFSVQHARRISADSRTSTESQGLPPDHFETSSQGSVSGRSDTISQLLKSIFDNSSKFSAPEVSEISSQGSVSELSDISSQGSVSGRSDTISQLLKSIFDNSSKFSASEVSDIGEDYWELMETQSEASNPGVGDTLSQKQQPARQVVTEKPFHHKTPALPYRATTLPTPAKQQKITDSNRQQSLKKIKRLSRHEAYNNTLSSEQTDDEFTSTNEQIRQRARYRLNKRRRAADLGITFAEYVRNNKVALAASRDMTVPQLRKQESKNQADRLGITVAMLERYRIAVQAAKRCTTPQELSRKRAAARAARRNMTMTEQNREYKQKQALKKAQNAQLETQSEASNPGVGDTLSQKQQLARQVATTQNPFHHETAALPGPAPLTTPAPLPTPPKQQKITDSNRQQSLKIEERLSEHEAYKDTPSSEQTDDEFKSPDKKIRKRARYRLNARKSKRARAAKLNTTVPELKRRQRRPI